MLESAQYQADLTLRATGNCDSPAGLRAKDPDELLYEAARLAEAMNLALQACDEPVPGYDTVYMLCWEFIDRIEELRRRL